MTRNQRRAQNRQAARLSESRIEPQPTALPTMEPNRRSRIKSTDIPGLMRHDTPRRHKPRNTWNQPGWSGISPFYRTMTTIDSRWDK